MKNLVVLSGAGMSAESGISTFRDSGGLWEKYRVEEVATPEAWYRNSELVMDFYNQRRRQLLNAKPNKGHLILADLEKHLEIQIITQNVDNLHEKAGSSNVLHLHGELMKVRSTGPGEETFDVDINSPDIKIGDMCPKGYQLRPHIVWFGEAVPMIEPAVELVQKADILLIIGTSLQVYPAAGLINYTKKNTPVYLIDPNEISNLSGNIHVISKGASDGMEEFRNIILK